MSSAASRPPQYSGQYSGQSLGPSGSQSGDGLRKPPSRPQLMGPPARPKPAPAPEPPPAETAAPAPTPEVPQKTGPISPPSERMQYRAIGLLKGKYIASEEQFNRGDIAAEDGTLVDAVLLGRVTSLIKKHIDLASDHLWVVYPRTLYSDENVPALHVQIVGVWEPEKLNARNDSEETKEKPEEKSKEASQYLSTAEAAEQCDTFSVRGEVAKYSDEKSEIVVNIVQKSKSETVKPKRPFKLLISGQLSGRTTGYFWDLTVERQAGKLVLKEATQIAVVPPKRKAKDARKEGGNRRRPPGGTSGKPRSSSAPVPKPVPKPKGSAETGIDEKVAEKTNSAEPTVVPTAAKATPVETSAVKSAAADVTTESVTSKSPEA